jgi:hypothetical protein
MMFISQMDERHQCFVMKFLWLQEQGSKAIHAHIRGSLGDLVVSLPTLKQWLHRFRKDDTSCEDRTLPGTTDSFGICLSKFPSKQPFAAAKILRITSASVYQQ